MDVAKWLKVRKTRNLFEIINEHFGLFIELHTYFNFWLCSLFDAFLVLKFIFCLLSTYKKNQNDQTLSYSKQSLNIYVR